MDAKKTELSRQIESISEGVSNVVRELRKSRAGASTVSHSIFQIFPTTKNRRFEYSHCEAVSQWVFDNLLRECEAGEHEAACRLYYNLARLPWADSLRGCLFERQVLYYLDSIKTNHDLPMRGLTNPHDEALWTYRGPINRSTFEERTVANSIKKAVADRTPVHLVPLIPNFPTVDSIVYHPDDNVLTCIQITIKDVRPIATSGLRRIQKWLIPQTPSACLRPRPENPWRFIFIVRSDTASNFTLQAFEGETPDAWAQKVDQFVLGLDEETLFGDRSKWNISPSSSVEQVQC